MPSHPSTVSPHHSHVERRNRALILKQLYSAPYTWETIIYLNQSGWARARAKSDGRYQGDGPKPLNALISPTLVLAAFSITPPTAARYPVSSKRNASAPRATPPPEGL